ncbi:MAG: DUF2017 domain-containing protein [Angustibacter sp.]
MRGFYRSAGQLRLEIAPAARELFAGLLDQVHSLLTPDGDAAADAADELAAMVMIGTATTLPSDPAVARLLPDAHRDDPQAAAEFRRYTEPSLRERKRAGLRLARACLEADPITLTPEQAQAMVVALTDVRLVVATRMGLTTEADHERLAALARADEQLAFLLHAYDFLTWLQESLVAAMVGR